MITIPIDAVVGYDDTAIIILKDTWISYVAQCGGIGCTHPEAEGFVISGNNLGSDFDDCSYGCSHIPDMPEQRLKLANDFDKYAEKYLKYSKLKVSFDYDRITETQEGWIPILVSGVIDEFYDFELVNEKGFLHAGNCD